MSEGVSTQSGRSEVAVEEGDFPLRAIDVQVPSQVEQGLSTPERPVGDPQRTAGTSVHLN